MARPMTVSTAPQVRVEALRGHAAMLLFALVISGSFSLGDRAVRHIDPGALTAMRFALAATVTAAVAANLAKARHFASPWRFLVIGGLFAAYFVLMFEALELTDPISLAAIFTLTPVFSALFARALLGQRTSAVVGAALILGACGALWVIFRGDLAALVAIRLGPGETLFLIGCMAHAAYTPMVARLNRGEPAAVFGLGALLGGLIATLGWSGRAVVDTDWLALPGPVWLAILYLGVMATALTFFLVRFAALRIQSAKVMAYGYLVPGFVIVWEGLLGGRWVAPEVWLGVLTILVTLVILLAEDRIRTR